MASCLRVSGCIIASLSVLASVAPDSLLLLTTALTGPRSSLSIPAFCCSDNAPCCPLCPLELPVLRLGGKVKGQWILPCVLSTLRLRGESCLVSKTLQCLINSFLISLIGLFSLWLEHSLQMTVSQWNQDLEPSSPFDPVKSQWFSPGDSFAFQGIFINVWKHFQLWQLSNY